MDIVTACPSLFGEPDISVICLRTLKFSEAQKIESAMRTVSTPNEIVTTLPFVMNFIGWLDPIRLS